MVIARVCIATVFLRPGYVWSGLFWQPGLPLHNKVFRLFAFTHLLVWILIALSIILPVLVYGIVQEKEHNMMGIDMLSYWLSNYVFYVAVLVFMALIGPSCIMH